MIKKIVYFNSQESPFTLSILDPISDNINHGVFHPAEAQNALRSNTEEGAMPDKTSHKTNKCCSASSALHREKYSASLRLCLSYSRRALTFLSSEALGSRSCIGSSMRELVFVCGRVCLRVTHPEGILAVTSRRDPSHTTWFFHIHMLLCPLLRTTASDSCVCRSTIWLIIVSLPSFASSFRSRSSLLPLWLGFSFSVA